MKIKSFEVVGLFQKENHINLNFHDDINIITGRNGSGKTSVLKLLWYIMSGHIFLGIKEVNFKKAKLVTDIYECNITKTGRYTCKIEWKSENLNEVFEDIIDNDGDVYQNAEDQANELLATTGNSIFLPTFRRIEGGFTIGERSSNNLFIKSKGDIEESLITLSKNSVTKITFLYHH